MVECVDGPVEKRPARHKVDVAAPIADANISENGTNGGQGLGSTGQDSDYGYPKYTHWQQQPEAKVVHEEENPLSTKASAIAAASRGDNCVLIPSSNERLVVSGPYIQLLGYDAAKALWRASVMILTPPSKLTVLPAEPVLTLYDDGKSKQVQGLMLDEHAGWKFWRFDLAATLGDAPRQIEYAIDADGLDKAARYPVALQSSAKGWNWGFHSCNGLSASADVRKWKDPALWKDVLRVHERIPLHALVGGGDQIYNDALWATPSMKAWLDIPNTEERLNAPFTLDMEKEVSEFLFHHYRVHLNARPYMSMVFSCIPQMNLWDDHDIWDGWGSYPEHLQNCPVFQGAYKICRRFYLRFQHHTTEELSRSMNDLFGPEGTFSWCRQVGDRVAILGPDCRAQRTDKRIISPEAYDQLFARIDALPQTIKHLVVVSTVPVVFPKLPLSEATFKALDALPFVKGALQKTGLAAGIVDKFDHADLLDDIVDHWDANTHKHERRFFVERLQAVAKAREARVSFLSGDVHCGGVGRLYSRPKMAHLRHDHRFMPQVVSSAVWNCPPPPVLIALLERTNVSSKINHNTQEKMVKNFDSGQKLVGARNWCFVEEVPPTQLPASRSQTPKLGATTPAAAAAAAGGGNAAVLSPESPAQQKSSSSSKLSRWLRRPLTFRDREKMAGALLYTLRVEDVEHMDQEAKSYVVICPQLLWNPLRNHVAVRRSSLFRACMCIPTSKEEDPLEEL